MHLKQLKLAGFKSFVDPTVVHFPSQLVAVVGPNGCGKSNIIDAVRWVMGESSAKNLRGESMIDVIFNGSSNRKSVGQASVELVFDNSLGRLTGPFASYGEIAVKRVVTRDGDSSYYLNGSRCRRKDITDIFLGTGAGARGYSIIGQGTISRLIEAKPEELRAFLEEAAGVSKYKERRRETVQRISHTRENLTRVADIREELDKQLARLERQAKAAERYTLLKEEEKLCRAEILALKWQEFAKQQSVKQQELQELAVIYEQHQSTLTGLNAQRTDLNERLHDATDASQQIQTTFYQLGTEIARLEESMQQQERDKKRLEQDRQQLQDDWQKADEQLKQDNNDVTISQLVAEELTTKMQLLNTRFKETQCSLDDEQETYSEWERHGQEIQYKINQINSDLQVARVKEQLLEQRKNQTLIRLEKINSEQNAIALEDLERTKISLEEQQVTLKESVSFDEEQLHLSLEQTNKVRAELQSTELELHRLQDEYHRMNTEYAALNASQRAARAGNRPANEGIKEWADKSRLIDILRVESKWQSACEMVLDDALHAYVLEEFSDVWFQINACEQQGESVVTLRDPVNTSTYPKLAEKISGRIPASLHQLDHILTAQDLDEALEWIPELAAHESIVTLSGLWIGKGWVKCVIPKENDEMGLLARQQKINDLKIIVVQLQEQIEAQRALRDSYQHQVKLTISAYDQCQLNLNASNEALRTNQAALTANEQAFAHAQKMSSALLVEHEELNGVLEEISAESLESFEQIRLLESTLIDCEEQHTDFTNKKEHHRDKLLTYKNQLEETRTLLHQSEMQHNREQTKILQLTDRISREQERLNILQERLEGLALLFEQSLSPNLNLQEQLNEYLLRHSEVETQLTESRELLAELRQKLEEVEKKMVHFDHELKQLSEKISNTRIMEQELSVRASSVDEALQESGFTAHSILEYLPAGITQSMREEELLNLVEKMKRLGAINLAAIEEYATEQQRKIYLDEQYNDLSEALAILETAIEKMDKETRSRLETTFDEVNTSFKALFPRLFGGGRAQLELTCDNLLEAGIVVMAQPPGKRNSTIHLLSGGEKAMTAVALVFAIFQLNPSPFCMLDEVDAPLDDVNVGRFCDLVKEMSQFVQFLFITHNKVTMELADHLIGVTMREPGVSRLVAVDVKHALTME